MVKVIHLVLKERYKKMALVKARYRKNLSCKTQTMTKGSFKLSLTTLRLKCILILNFKRLSFKFIPTRITDQSTKTKNLFSGPFNAKCPKMVRHTLKILQHLLLDF